MKFEPLILSAVVSNKEISLSTQSLVCQGDSFCGVYLTFHLPALLCEGNIVIFKFLLKLNETKYKKRKENGFIKKRWISGEIPCRLKSNNTVMKKKK